jgi:S-methylmethionine-dependent homocysteine/selenocysteine methylase
VPRPGPDPLAELLSLGPQAIDGGLAGELEARGHDLRDPLWSAKVLADDPDAVIAVHLDYFRAGARVAISASYQASRSGFAARGLGPDEADRLLRLSVSLAAQARDEALAEGVPGPLLVAASVGPFGATRADGSEYRGRYGVPRGELASFHAERLAVLAAAGPDLFAVETIPDADEAEVLVDALAAYPNIPAWLTFSCADDATTAAGQPFAESVAVAASGPTVVAVGVNCTAPQHVEGLLRLARTSTDLPLVAYPNAGGTWDPNNGRWHDNASATLPAGLVRRWADEGALLVGGCCGLGPDAIRGIATALAT